MSLRSAANEANRLARGLSSAARSARELSGHASKLQMIGEESAQTTARTQTGGAATKVIFGPSGQPLSAVSVVSGGDGGGGTVGGFLPAPPGGLHPYGPGSPNISGVSGTMRATSSPATSSPGGDISEWRNYGDGGPNWGDDVFGYDFDEKKGYIKWTGNRIIDPRLIGKWRPRKHYEWGQQVPGYTFDPNKGYTAQTGNYMRGAPSRPTTPAPTGPIKTPIADVGMTMGGATGGSNVAGFLPVGDQAEGLVRSMGQSIGGAISGSLSNSFESLSKSSDSSVRLQVEMAKSLKNIESSLRGDGGASLRRSNSI